MTTGEAKLFFAWAAFTGLVLLNLIAVLVWAVRDGQFAGQDRARFLALTSEIPEDD